VFQFSQRILDRINDHSQIYTTIPFTINSDKFNKNSIFYTAGDGILTIQNVEKVSVLDNNKIQIKEFTIQSTHVTLEIKGNSLEFIGTSNYGENGKTTIKLTQTKTFFVTTRYTGIFTATVNSNVVSNVECSALTTDEQKNAFNPSNNKVTIKRATTKTICRLDPKECPNDQLKDWRLISSYDTVYILGPNKLSIEPKGLLGVKVFLLEGSYKFIIIFSLR